VASYTIVADTRKSYTNVETVEGHPCRTVGGHEKPMPLKNRERACGRQPWTGDSSRCLSSAGNKLRIEIACPDEKSRYVAHTFTARFDKWVAQ